MRLLTGTEHLAAAIAAAGKLGIVAVTAVDLVELGAELLIHQGDAALGAKEAGLMPVLVLVRQVLRKKRTATDHRMMSTKVKTLSEFAVLTAGGYMYTLIWVIGSGSLLRSPTVG